MKAPANIQKTERIFRLFFQVVSAETLFRL